VPPIFPHEFRRTVLWILLLIASDLTPTGLSPSLAVHSRTFGFSQEALEKVLTPHLPPLSGRHSVCLLPLSIAFNNGRSKEVGGFRLRGHYPLWRSVPDCFD
jgi:hypothetical protein